MYLALYTVDYENLIVPAQLELLEGARVDQVVKHTAVGRTEC